MVAGAAAASAFGVVVALVTVRLRGDYLAIVTLGFAETMRIVMSNELWLANGTDGLSGIPGPFRGTLGPHLFNLFYLGIVVAARDRAVLPGRPPGARPVRPRAARHPRRRADRAGGRQERRAVQGQGLRASAPRRSGLAGALYGHFTSYIAPDLFAPLLTLYIKLVAARRRARQQQGRGARRRPRRLLPRVDALHRAADPERLRRAGCGAARAADIRGAAGDPALLRQGPDPGAHRASRIAPRRSRPTPART